MTEAPFLIGKAQMPNSRRLGTRQKVVRTVRERAPVALRLSRGGVCEDPPPSPGSHDTVWVGGGDTLGACRSACVGRGHYAGGVGCAHAHAPPPWLGHEHAGVCWTCASWVTRTVTLNNLQKRARAEGGATTRHAQP